MGSFEGSVPSTLSELFRKEWQWGFAVGVLCDWLCRRSSRISHLGADTLTHNLDLSIKPLNFHNSRMTRRKIQ